MKRPCTSRPRSLTIVSALLLALSAGLAHSQLTVRTGPAVRAPGTATQAGAPAATPGRINNGIVTGLPAGSPSPSGLSSGSAPGLGAGSPSPSGITSGTAAAVAPLGTPATTGLTSGSAALPPGAPAPSGLTSGTAASTGPVGTVGSLGSVVPLGTVIPVAPVGPLGNAAPTGAVPDSRSFPVGATPDRTATTAGGSTRGVVVFPGTAAAGTTAGGIGVAAGTTGTVGVVQQPLAQGSEVAAASMVSGATGFRGPLSGLQVAQLFRLVDQDADGRLNRLEAQRLPIVTMAFEDMDSNRDGVLSLAEYDASLR